MADSIIHFEIHANDVEKTKKFYEGVFGWSFRDAGMEGYWLVSTGRTKGQGGGQIGIDGGLVKRDAAVEGDERPNAFVCTVQVDDIDATIIKAKELGGTVASNPDKIPNVGTWARLKDPSGNSVAVLQP